MNIMTHSGVIWVALLLVLPAARSAADEPQRKEPLRPAPLTDVRLEDAFWAPRIEVNRKVSIPHSLKMCEQTGRIGNFDRAAGKAPGAAIGLPWCDSDVYKVIEGASYALRLHPDPNLQQRLADLIAKIAAAQKEDGYLYTPRTGRPDEWHEYCGKTRWSHRHSHELFDAGHLYEAAVAYYQATGKRDLLDVALKNADLLCRTFGPGKPYLRNHPEIELALVKLYGASRNEQYLTLAKRFLEDRGRNRGPQRDAELDLKPLEEQTEPIGHAVCALYTYTAMTDLALFGDTRYLKAADRIWETMVAKRLYLTGGVGARGEGFLSDYDLPNHEAVCETCAAMASILWTQRLFLLHGDAKYVDVLERTLYNGAAADASLSGDRFFYANPLAFDGKLPFNMGSPDRQPWLGSACCPSFVVRFFPLIGSFVYASRADDLYVNLFVAGRAKVAVAGGSVEVRQETRYPWDGALKLTLHPKQAGEFTVRLRIPGWAQGRPVPGDLYSYLNPQTPPVVLKVNGEPRPLALEKGFACIRRAWADGDTIECELPMPVRRVVSHSAVKDDRGRVALERGPIVYCVEGCDHGGKVLDLVLPDDAQLRVERRDDFLSGVNVLRGRALAASRGSDGAISVTPRELTAIPYCVWANRGVGEMAVWLPRDAKSMTPR